MQVKSGCESATWSLECDYCRYTHTKYVCACACACVCVRARVRVGGGGGKEGEPDSKHTSNGAHGQVRTVSDVSPCSHLVWDSLLMAGSCFAGLLPACHLTLRELGLRNDLGYVTWFSRDLGIPTWNLMTAQQAVSPLSHFPSPTRKTWTFTFLLSVTG